MSTIPLVPLTPGVQFVETPGHGSPDTIIGSNEMTKAMVAFAKLMNDYIQMNAELAVQLANYQNTVNQNIPGQINTAETQTGVAAILIKLRNDPTYQMTPAESSDVTIFSTEENQIMSQGQAETQGVQTSLTGATNAIQALQQSMNEFMTETGSTIDTTLANDRIQ